METEIKWADGQAVTADSTIRWADGQLFVYYYEDAGQGVYIYNVSDFFTLKDSSSVAGKLI